MIYNLPFYPHYYRKYNPIYPPNINRNNHQTIKTQNEKHNTYSKNKNPERVTEINAQEDNDDIIFEIFGIKLHSDDILLICLIFFLFKEEVNDEYLFISLILLLLS